MAAIITAHMAQSNARCRASQTVVIIQALAPVIGPYMSRAIATIQIHDAAGRRITRTTTAARWLWRSADSSNVGEGSCMDGFTNLRIHELVAGIDHMAILNQYVNS